MEFLEIKIENFLSIANETLRLDNRGVLLISGENGAGKSSLTSKAIAWALFGQTLKGVKGDSVVNVTDPSGPCGVEVTFRVGGKVHTAHRRRNPASLELDGQRFRVPSETQRAIEQLVGRDLDAFMATDYFGQDRATDFLAMTPTSQMETMEGILRLSRLDELVVEAKERAALERAGLELDQNTLRSRQGQTEELVRQMTAATSRYDQLQASLDFREAHRRQLDLREKELRRSILKGPVDEALVDLRRIELQLDEVTEQLRKHDVSSEHYKALSIQLRIEVSSYRSQLKDIQDAICPTCGGTIQKELTDRLREEQKVLQLTYDNLLGRQAGVSEWLGTCQETHVALRNQKMAYERKLSDSNQNFEKFEQSLAELNELRATQRAHDEREKAIMLELVGMVDTMTKQRTDLETMMAVNEAASKRGLHRLSMINYWMDIFGKTFRNMILEQALPFLQERTEYHLRLLNNSALRVSFSTQKTLKSGEERQQFTVTAFRDQGGQSEMALSGGERQIVSFAVGLALSELADSQTGSASNLMILDEPFTMLDEGNCEEVVQYVTTELVKRKATILLISNDDRMKALIPGGLHVKRGDDGKSRVDGT